MVVHRERDETAVGRQAPTSIDSPSPLLAVAAQSARNFSSLSEALEAVFGVLRPLLGMRSLFLSSIDPERLRFRLVAVANDAGGLDLVPGSEAPLAYTHCQQVAATGTPLVVPDSRQEPFFAALPAATDFHVCGYVGVPVVRGDGSLFGTLCGVDAEPHRRSEQEVAQEVAVMQALARLVAFQMEKEARDRLEGALLAARTAQHEANNRLTAALGYAEMVAEDPELPDSLAPSLTEAIDGVRSAAALLQQLGQITRIEETDWGMTTTIDLTRSARGK